MKSNEVRGKMSKFKFHLNEIAPHLDRIATLHISNRGTLELHINGEAVFTVDNEGGYFLEYARDTGLPCDGSGILLPRIPKVKT